MKNNSVEKLYTPSVFGVGFIGIGKYRHRDYPKIYNVWSRILRRCYESKFHDRQPTYKDCTIEEDWKNFQNFAKWYEENYNPETMQDFQLDKDILVKENKIYSPETCCFVPVEINNIFTKTTSKRGKYPIGVRIKTSKKFEARVLKNNKSLYIGSYNTPEEAFQAYKTEKEKYIKEIADKWKGLISDKVYEAMYDYKVEITD